MRKLQPDRPGVVVVGGYINGTGVVRALGREGIPVDVVLTLESDLAHRSRFVKKHYILLDITRDLDVLVNLLEAHQDSWGGWVVLPTNDFALAALAQNHERLSQLFRLAAPPWSIVKRVINKRQTARFARALGIPVPESYGIAKVNFEGAGELRYPVLIKPTEGHRFYRHFKTKLFKVEDERAFLSITKRIADADFECEVVQYIPGSDTCLYNIQVYIDGQGRPHGVCADRKLRQNTPLFGVACAGETTEASCLQQQSIALLKAVGWKGFAQLQYKRDPRDGNLYFFEINGRSSLNNGLSLRRGLNFPLMAYSELVDGEVRGDEPNGWSGVWIHLHADVFTACKNWGQGEFTWRKILASYRRPKTFAVWAVDDPLPFLTQWGRTLWRGFKRILPSLRRNEGDNRSVPTIPPRTP